METDASCNCQVDRIGVLIRANLCRFYKNPRTYITWRSYYCAFGTAAPIAQKARPKRASCILQQRKHEPFPSVQNDPFSPTKGVLLESPENIDQVRVDHEKLLIATTIEESDDVHLTLDSLETRVCTRLERYHIHSGMGTSITRTFLPLFEPTLVYIGYPIELCARGWLRISARFSR